MTSCEISISFTFIFVKYSEISGRMTGAADAKAHSGTLRARFKLCP